MAGLKKGSQVKPRHLVDSVPMILYQRRDGNGTGMAWYGRWREGKRQRTRYFGVVDPRERYPILKSNDGEKDNARS